MKVISSTTLESKSLSCCPSVYPRKIPAFVLNGVPDSNSDKDIVKQPPPPPPSQILIHIYICISSLNLRFLFLLPSIPHSLETEPDFERGLSLFFLLFVTAKTKTQHFRSIRSSLIIVCVACDVLDTS